MSLSNKAIAAIAARYYLPFGCGIDAEDIGQEAAIAALGVADRPHGYARRSVHNALGMLVERERRRKRLPVEGYRSMSEDFGGAQNGNMSVSRASGEACSLPPPERWTEEEVYVGEVLGALSATSREVIRLRLDPSAMRDYYERVDRPMPTTPSYKDLADHLGVTVAAVIKAIDEARRIVLADA